jgi:cytochrome c5
MNKFTISSIFLALSLALSVNAMAANMSKDEYEAAEKRITVEYRSDKGHCASLAGNAKDICMAEAKGKDNVAKAELEAQYKPSKKAINEVSVAKAEADYFVAREKCDDKAGNKKDVCVKEAKAALVRAEADAKVQLETSQTNATAGGESSKANPKAQEKGSAAPVAAPAATADAGKGKSLFGTTCVACHGTGVAGAPKVGDKAAWSPRIAQGKDTLYKHALGGFTGKSGMMPAKGGNAGASDDGVKAAVDYMVGLAK